MVVVPAFLVLLAVFFTSYSGGNGKPTVNIRADGGIWAFPLDAEETVRLSGPLGETVVRIEGGRAYVLSSPCADGICITMGAIRKPGGWVACLPNRVMLYVAEENGDEDIVAR